MSSPIPSFNTRAGPAALRELLGPRNLLGSLSAMSQAMGAIFRLPLKRFSPVVLTGPQALHEALVDQRQNLRWRNEADPVTGLLGHGLLVEDGEAHDALRRQVMPALHRKQVEAYIGKMWQRTEQVLDGWQAGQTYDMLVEMRRLALLIVMDTLFDVDISADYERLLPVILDLLKLISPGLWLLGVPARKYEQSIAAMDEYLFGLIHLRRQGGTNSSDLLSQMTAAGMEDRLIRDQMLTLLIAGHDTSTALLAWALYLIGRHPTVQETLLEESRRLPLDRPPSPEEVEGLVNFEQVINETLRLYPPIHAGNRIAADPLPVCGVEVPQGERVLISYYATHHDDSHWPEPEKFKPDRFLAGQKHTPYTFVPFGGGPRNCLGANFAQVEAKVILARIYQRFDLTLMRKRVSLHMGATLEPRPGVFIKVLPA